MRKPLLLSLLISSCLAAQSQVRVGLFGGIANYQGDLVEGIYKNSRGAGGITVGYNFTGHFGVRAGLTLGRVVGADSLSTNDSRKGRNLSFQTPITEFSVVGELNAFDLNMKRWTPYAFGGIGVFRFNPWTYDGAGQKVYLQPLSTEGQGLTGSSKKQYNLTQLAVPFGGGVKFALTDHFHVALEVGLRKLFTDYLDDVSTTYADEAQLLAERGQQAVDISYRSDEIGGSPAYPQKGYERGSARNKDYYYFSGLHLIFLIPGSGGASSGKFRKGQLGCPTIKQ